MKNHKSVHTIIFSVWENSAMQLNCWGSKLASARLDPKIHFRTYKWVLECFLLNLVCFPFASYWMCAFEKKLNSQILCQQGGFLFNPKVLEKEIMWLRVYASTAFKTLIVISQLWDEWSVQLVKDSFSSPKHCDLVCAWLHPSVSSCHSEQLMSHFGGPFHSRFLLW